jgi:small-conductance mechanosensitive channel
MPFEFDVNHPTLMRWLTTLVIVAVAFIISRLSRRVVDRYIEEAERKYRVGKLISRSMAVLALLLIVALWSERLSALLTILTIIGAGTAVALRDVLLSFAGWLNISLSAPYRQGDRIEVNGMRGDVVDIRVLHTVLMEIGGWVQADQSTGRLVRIPNNWVYQYDVANYTRGFGFVWNEIEVTVTFRSDWKAARDILQDLAETHVESAKEQAEDQLRHLAREHLVHYEVLTPYVYLSLTDHGVKLTLRHLTPVRGRRNIRHNLTVELLTRFSNHGRIELAYPALQLQTFDTPQLGPDAPHFDPSTTSPASSPPE